LANKKTTAVPTTIAPRKETIREIIKKPKEKFLTKAQEKYWKLIDKNQITICLGPSGTGKSYIAMKKSVDLLYEDNKYEKIIIIRPAVESDDRSIGALPGNLEEKMEPYVAPTFYILKKIIGKESIDKLKEGGFIEVFSFNFLRGWTIDNSLVILEEAQNTTIKQMKLFLTRIGYNSKFIISGDLEQSDYFKDITKSGLYDAKERFKDLNDVGIFEFDITDIVRNDLISKILERYN
jgi:phosphate starvation-inducible PhoH-like protein